jgi:thiol-disulfide isomerase/thioredoxin
MIDNSNADNDLGFLQKFFLALLSLFLVALLFFSRSGFKANAMLDQLANNSLEPDIALSNGKPTVFEFYADWCEACKEMAPDMVDAEKINSNKIDIVLLNVDNSRWFDLIDKYDVNGIPQLTFFNDKGEFKGFSLGVRKFSELNEIFNALINNSELPSFTNLSNSSNLIPKNNSQQLNNNAIRSEGPRNHSYFSQFKADETTGYS